MILAASFPLSAGIILHSPKLTWVGMAILAIPIVCGWLWLFYVLWEWLTSPTPRVAKARSKLVAEEYLRLGWTLIREFSWPSGSPSRQYLFEWRHKGKPVRIDPKRFGDEPSSD
jgi:hypothetical protein